MSQSRIELEIEEVKDVDQLTRIYFKGDLDATNIEEVVEKVFKVVNERGPKIIADFSELRYVNSTGIGILLHFSKATQNEGGFFTICSVNKNVADIIRVVGANTLISIYDTFEDALKSAVEA